MYNCKHKVVFDENEEEIVKCSIITHNWSVQPVCFLCEGNVPEKDVEDALKNSYSTEVADVVFAMYEHKKAYLESKSKLSLFGIKNLM